VVRRLLLRFSAVPVVLVFGVVVYAGLARAGLAPNPFAPVTRVPGIVHRLAGRDRPIFAVSFTAGGWTLRKFAHDHASCTTCVGTTSSCRVQSQIPSFPARERAQEFEPYMTELTREGFTDGLDRRDTRFLQAAAWAIARKRYYAWNCWGQTPGV
jgi:hypothetical protein